MSIIKEAIKKIEEQSKSAPDAQVSTDRTPRVLGKMVEDAGGKTNERPAVHPKTDIRPSRIVCIDRGALRQHGFLPPESQSDELAMQYRVIKRPLILNASAPRAVGTSSQRLIMVTSALPGDGKTFSCINIALSIALERDCSVVLVDCDVIKPEVSRLFGVREEPGLLDVLADSSRPVESVIFQTDIPGLSVLGAGQQYNNASELLASARMRDVCQSIADRFPQRIVLFDTPPILLTSEARALASVVGQVVFIVSAGRTPQQAVREAIEALGTEKAISLVLNQVDLSNAMGYYGHAYRAHTEKDRDRL